MLALAALSWIPATLLPAGDPPPGPVIGEQKITQDAGGLLSELFENDFFGSSLAFLGDLDGDGTGDLAVGLECWDIETTCDGAVLVLFMNPDGTVKAEQRISSVDGGFEGGLGPGDGFGGALANLGDVDGDGVVDLAVGVIGDDVYALGVGAVWILFLNTDGTVKGHSKISGSAEGPLAQLVEWDRFGRSVTAVGDLNGDGFTDLAVGMVASALFPTYERGAVWILFLDGEGSVQSAQRIDDWFGNFDGELDDEDWFGLSVTSLGDLDGDGLDDLAVGAPGDDGDDLVDWRRGAVWILFLKSDGTVKSWKKINATEGGFDGALLPGDEFGLSLANLGDLDGDGVTDLAVGAPGDDDGLGALGNNGALWILYLEPTGAVRQHQKISANSGDLLTTLDYGDFFGSSVTRIEDLNGDGAIDIAVGAQFDDETELGQGSVHVLFLDGIAPAAFLPYGCGLNPPQSLRLGPDTPSIGTTIALGVDNPLGTQAAGSLPFVLNAILPAPQFPCGILAPGLGMASPDLPGELLIDPTTLVGPVLLGDPWTGAPSQIPLPIPNDPALIGLSLYTQGVLWDPAATFGIEFGLTEAVQVRVGP